MSGILRCELVRRSFLTGFWLICTNEGAMAIDYRSPSSPMCQINARITGDKVIGSVPDTVFIDIGAKFIVCLPVQLGWGGRWMIKLPLSDSLELVEERVDPGPENSADGSEETQVFVLRGRAVGTSQIVFEERRPFAPREPPRNSVAHTVHVELK